MRALAAVWLLALIAAASGAGERLDGKVVAIHDGDTLTLLDGKKVEHRIRLAQIDAPEVGHGRDDPGQPFGNAARQSLAELVYGREVRAECEARDRYGRSVCTLWLGRTDVNREQVRRGMAWVFDRYATDGTLYAIQDEARAARRGLWSEAAPVPPWDWRARGRR